MPVFSADLKTDDETFEHLSKLPEKPDVTVAVLDWEWADDDGGDKGDMDFVSEPFLSVNDAPKAGG